MKKLPNCFDCGKKLSHYLSKRCKSCSKKGKLNPAYEKKPHNYKGAHLLTDGYLGYNIKNKKYRLHRLIMENYIGRKLKKSEVVHHVDGNKLNNNIDNLEIIRDGYHSRLHFKGRKYADEREKNATS